MRFPDSTVQSVYASRRECGQLIPRTARYTEAPLGPRTVWGFLGQGLGFGGESLDPIMRVQEPHGIGHAPQHTAKAEALMPRVQASAAF